MIENVEGDAITISIWHFAITKIVKNYERLLMRGIKADPTYLKFLNVIFLAF